MLVQSHDETIIKEFFHQNQYALEVERCTDVYDETGHLIKLSLRGGYQDDDEPDFLMFPETFCELSHLRELYIYMPLVAFPEHLGQITSLEALVLSEFCPVDIFPAEFAQLTNLRYLGLGGLRWKQVPSVIWQLHNLRVLDLSNNSFTSLPPEIGQLTHLRSLYLYDTRLLQLPAEIGQLTELVELDIWPHSLQTLPDEITQLRKLDGLNLSPNLLKNVDIARFAREMGMALSPNSRFPSLQRRISAIGNTPPYPCTCCGYLTCQGYEYDCEVCPVCSWESDAYQRLNPSSKIGPNEVCLIEARLNFARTGASEDRLLTMVRSPQPEEIPDENARVPYMNFEK